MTPEQLAARWLADVPRYYKPASVMYEVDVLAAIARRLAPGDDLVERADKLRDECFSAVQDEGPRAYDWTDKPHRLVYDLCSTITALLARLAALTATVAELQAEVDRMIDPVAVDAMLNVAQPIMAEACALEEERANAAEAEAATLRTRLARMEGAQKLREEIAALEKLCDHDCDNEDCVRCFHYPEILEQKRKQLAALTDGGSNG